LAASALPLLGNTSKNNHKILPASPLLPDEQYWGLIKKQFTVPENLIMINAANLCPSPYFVQDEVTSLTKALGKDVSFQYRATLTTKRTAAMALLAEYLGVSGDEVAITRNTSESNNILVNGLDLKTGDEIVLWDQNHPTNGVAWEQHARRYGFVIKKVSVPAEPKSTSELIEPFAKAITGKTRLIAFSHISNTSGIALPAREICALARGKGILCHVDGAQSFGFMNINLKEIGCDFYSASVHKWFMGPLENGILYVNKEKIGKVWPMVIGAGWKDTGLTADEKFSVVGQRNDATVSSLLQIIPFHKQIGKKNIEGRVRELAQALKDKIQAKVPNAKFVSPIDPKVSAGIVIIELPGKVSADVYQRLYTNHGIACAPSGGIRFSPHIYNSMEDLDAVANALAQI
jgi:selenocysteine lyase/cysteine desulfurase